MTSIRFFIAKKTVNKKQKVKKNTHFTSQSENNLIELKELNKVASYTIQRESETHKTQNNINHTKWVVILLYCKAGTEQSLDSDRYRVEGRITKVVNYFLEVRDSTRDVKHENHRRT